MIFKQTDPSWSNFPLGSSPYTMGDSGCTTTNIAQALQLAGYDVTPGSVNQAFTAHGVYTDSNHPFGPGLVNWPLIANAFPQFHWKGSDEYQFEQGLIGMNTHWLLLHNGVEYDPLTGSNERDAWVRNLHTSTTASIDPASNFPRTITVTGSQGAHVRTTAYLTGELIDPDTHQVTIDTSIVIASGNTFTAVGQVEGESINGNSIWYQSQNGHFIWSGNCQ